MVFNKHNKRRGFLLIEAMIVSAIMLIVFGGLLAGFRQSFDLISNSRAKLSALSLATSQMEFVRSLSYDAVGTVSGIPAGAMPQVSTTSLNKIDFTKTILIEYVDDDADGLGVADSNGITTDYKRVKVTLNWLYRGVAKELFLTTNIIPRSIETNMGGGTLRVNVFDAGLVPLPGADVHLVNTTLVPNIDITRTTDATGIVLFGGAPAGADYQISVTAPGYSTDKTYIATTSIPNPTNRPVAVLVGGISTMNFFIDRLSTVTIKTFATRSEATVTESFIDASGIATSTGTVVSGGALQLAGSAPNYTPSGTAYLTTLTPSPLSQWGVVTLDVATPGSTIIKTRVYAGTSTLSAVSDSVLPGNSAGFTTNTISLSTLDVALYPSLTFGLELSTSNLSVTPSVREISVRYFDSKIPLGGLPFSWLGTKTIGTEVDAVTPVYKYSAAQTMPASGVKVLSSIEWDSYTFSASGYDVAEACPENPYVVSPNASTTLELLLTADTAHSLRVVTKTSSGSPVIGATVTLSRSGYSVTQQSTSCGQVFFGGISSETDYTLDISAPNFTTQSITPVSISGDGVQLIVL